MNRQNWFTKQLVLNTDMLNLEAASQTGIKAAIGLWNNSGTVSGLVATQTASPSLSVAISAGTVVLEDGSLVNTTPRILDLSRFAGVASVVYIYGIPFANSDTPMGIPSGATINYRLFDDMDLVAQLQNVQRNPIPGTTYSGIVIAAVTFPGAVGSIVNAYIDQTFQDKWIDIRAIKRLTAIQVIAPSATPTFDAATSTTFELTLNQNMVLQPILNLKKGDLLTIMLIQDATGGRTFTWPASVPGDMPDPGPGKISTFAFKVMSNGTIVNNGGMTIN